MISDQFVKIVPESQKGPKPKPVKRPKGKGIPYKTNDVVSERQGGILKTR